jgi:dTDP-glucose pyrophosphorylase
VFIDKDSCINCLVIDKEDIRRVISAIDKGGLRIALILNNKGQLIGTISDGDIRRGLLKGLTLDSSLLQIINKNCLKANLKTNRSQITKMMRENAISQIPIVSEDNVFIGLEISDDLLPNSGKSSIPNYALLMAGGRGSRLSPITDNCPKPLLPINEKPILEIILEQCIQSGIRNFFISVHYLAEKIINYFEDGSKWDVNITYLHEDSPLGTAGALKLLPSDFQKSIVLINGDVLTKINYQNLLKYHAINSADITICAREQILSSPYGVIEVDGIDFKSMVEKPSFRQLVNAGIYVLKPTSIALVRKEDYLDMPDLIDIAKKRQKKIIVYPMHEYWLDIGKPEALNKAHFEWS